MNLFYRKFGVGEPLFILHGLFGSSDNWVTIGRQFMQKFQVIIIDMRNHGQSPHSEQMDYPSMAEDVYGLANSLGLKQIILMGHSMGGKIGMTITEQYPDLLKKLIVADISPRQYPVHHRQIIDGFLSIDLENIESRKEADAVLADYVTDHSIRQFLLKNLERDSEKGFKWKLNLDVINSNIENVGAATIPKMKISTPTLFIRGVNSNYVTDGDIMEIRKYYSNSRVESIGNAGHWLHAEQPEAFINTALEFLED